MMHGVEAPQAAAVEPAVLPVAEEVADDEHLDALKPQRLAAQQAMTLRERVVVQAEEIEQREQHDADGDGRDRLGNDRRPEPIDTVGPKALTQDLLSRNRGPEPRNHPVQDSEAAERDQQSNQLAQEVFVVGQDAASPNRPRSNAALQHTPSPEPCRRNTEVDFSRNNPILL